MKQTRKYEIYTPEFKNNPYPVYAEMRENEPIFQQPGLDGETMLWFVTSYELIDQILSDPRFVRDMHLAITDEQRAQLNEPPPHVAMIDNHMLNKDGADHRRLRTLVTKAFTPKAIREMRGRIEEIANRLLNGVIEDGEMDLVEQFAYPLPITVIAELLGIPMEDQHKFREWTHAFIAPAMDKETQDKFRQLMMEFINYFNVLLDERRKNPQDDLISGLLQAEEEGDQLSREELFSMIVLLIVAGHETTVSLIGNGAWLLLQDEALYARLQERPEDIPAAVEEFLRVEGPLERMLARWATEDVEIGGQLIKKGEIIILIIAAADRDPAQFENPDEIDLDRPHNRHLAFGKGAHFCLGAPLARLEGEIAFRFLLDRLPNLRLGIPAEEAVVRLNPTFRSFESLPVEWDTER